MTDIPLTHEEVKELLELCEVLAPMSLTIDSGDVELVLTARIALPRALREVLRLQDEVASLRRTLDAVDRVLRSEG